ncbi:MAG: hypothetical protein HKN48_10565 [Flavobacteriaceae bacterium]|nr:hypothetical protein [Flavobacteriaceae bacterium]
MYKHLLICLLITSEIVLSQTNPDVFIMDLSISEEKIETSNLKNLSQNKGYDNQPSFYDNETLLFAGTREEATDIAMSTGQSTTPLFKFLKTEGGEYSPQRIPNSEDVSAVRLDLDGTQRLYKYEDNTDKSVTRIHDDLQVAYYAYADENTILASVLSGNNMDLVFLDIKTSRVDTLLEASGRSIHKVPDVNSMSYTARNEEGNWDVYQFDLESKESFFVCQLPIGIQDHIWLDDSKLLIGSGDKLFWYDLYGNGDWKQVADLSGENIQNITRLAVSLNGKRLSIVAEPIEQ